MRTEENNQGAANSYCVPEEAARYFTYLDPNTDEFDFRLIWPKEKGDPPKEQNRVVNMRGPFQNLVETLRRANQQGYGLFVTVNETDGKGVKTRNVTRVRSVFADFDNGVPDRFPLEPSLVVETSPGKAQVYWLLEDEMAPAQFARVMSCLVSNYNADPAAKDLARVFRVPGFNHTKGEAYPVKLVASNERQEPKRYLTRDLLDAFPSSTKPQIKKPATLDKYVATINGGSFDQRRVTGALNHVPAGDYATWTEMGMALHHATAGGEQGFEIWDRWSKQSEKYDASGQRAKWNSFSADTYEGTTISLGTLFARAKEHGWSEVPKRELIVVPEKVAQVTHFDKSALEWGTEVCNRKAEAEEAWKPDELGELMQRMNADHAYVDIGGKVVVTKTEINPLFGTNVVFMSPEAMRQKYGAVVIGGTENRPITAFNKWERWPGRRYYEGVGMFPGSSIKPSKAPKNYLNLWGGLQVTPQRGDWSLVRNHMLMMCGGNEEHFNWWLDWKAQLLQEPQIKPGSAIVLRSSQKGTGKSMFAGFWQKIYGPQHVAAVTSSEQITGRFNAITGQSVLVFLEEASWGGSKAAGNALKERITGATTTLERKGLDPIVQPNHTRYWFNSNEDWIVPAGTEERRYFIAEFEFDRANDRTYFNPLFRQMKDEGGIEAMVHELLDRRIESDLFNPPSTAGLQRQREFSLSGPERYLLEAARSGQVGEDNMLNRSFDLEDSSIIVPTSAVQAAARDYCDEYEGRALNTRLGTILAEVGVTKAEKRNGIGKKQYVYRFPSSEQFRARVSARLKLPIVPVETLAGDEGRI